MAKKATGGRHRRSRKLYAWERGLVASSIPAGEQERRCNACGEPHQAKELRQVLVGASGAVRRLAAAARKGTRSRQASGGPGLGSACHPGGRRGVAPGWSLPAPCG